MFASVLTDTPDILTVCSVAQCIDHSDWVPMHIGDSTKSNVVHCNYWVRCCTREERVESGTPCSKK